MRSNIFHDPIGLIHDCLKTPLEYGVGLFKDRPIRYLEESGVLQIGEPLSSFDRWANSVDFELDLWSSHDQLQLIQWSLNYEQH